LNAEKKDCENRCLHNYMLLKML